MGNQAVLSNVALVWSGVLGVPLDAGQVARCLAGLALVEGAVAVVTGAAGGPVAGAVRPPAPVRAPAPAKAPKLARPPRVPFWTPERDARIVARAIAGASVEQIARELGVTASAVTSRVHGALLGPAIRAGGGFDRAKRSQGRNRAWSDAQLEEIVAMAVSGATDDAIALHFGRSKPSVTKAIFNYRLLPRIVEARGGVPRQKRRARAASVASGDARQVARPPEGAVGVAPAAPAVADPAPAVAEEAAAVVQACAPDLVAVAPVEAEGVPAPVAAAADAPAPAPLKPPAPAPDPAAAFSDAPTSPLARAQAALDAIGYGRRDTAATDLDLVHAICVKGWGFAEIAMDLGRDAGALRARWEALRAPFLRPGERVLSIEAQRLLCEAISATAAASVGKSARPVGVAA